ncbi:MAG TPA: ATP-binding protein [bacterium]|jgi:signal transduction histidine kinase
MQNPTLHKLQERVKELSALHRTARVLQEETRPSADVVREIVGLLPAAWQYPEITVARIRFQEISEATPDFRETPWMQTARFTAKTADEGLIEVAYLEERPPETEGPFLAEERELIESLADMLSSYFRRLLADRAIQAAQDNLEQLVAARTEELRTTNAKLAREVNEHRAARLQIEDYQNRLRQLTTELTLAEARERREIAVDLHDHIIQEFAFIKLRIVQFRGDAVFCGFERNLEEIIGLLEGAIHHTRQLTFEISTPILYELGLSAALEWLAEQYETRHKLKIKVKVQDEPRQLAEAIRVMLFKCVQELLTNVVKYAHTSQATITMKCEFKQLWIEVADNGKGFDFAKVENTGDPHRGFGLFSIRERLKSFGGDLVVHSAIGNGTTARISVRLEG